MSWEVLLGEGQMFRRDWTLCGRCSCQAATVQLAGEGSQEPVATRLQAGIEDSLEYSSKRGQGLCRTASTYRLEKREATRSTASRLAIIAYSSCWSCMNGP